MILGRRPDMDKFLLGDKMPIVMIISAIASIALFVAAFFKRKAVGAEAFAKTTFSLSFIGALCASVFAASALYFVLQRTGYTGESVAIMLLVLCVAVVLYIVKLTYKNEFFAYTLYSAIALMEIFAVRHVQGSDTKFYVLLILCAVVDLAYFAVIIAAKKCGGKLFGKKLFGKKFKLYPFVVAIATGGAALAIYAIFPAAFLYCVIAVTLQFFIVGICETVLSK